MTERQLRELAKHVEWPPQPDVGAAVAAGLRPARHRMLRPLVVAAVALVAVIVLVPTARDRVAAFFGIGDVEIVRGTLLDPSVVTDLGDPVDPTTLEIGLPAVLGDPDGVRVDPEGRLWAIYEEEGALLTVVNDAPGLTKLVEDPSIQVEPVEVNGGPALWVSGDEHFILFETPGGEIREDRGRLSAPTLIWLHAGKTYRLESDIDLDRALEIAESVP